MSRQPANANPSRPVRQHSGDRSAHTPGPWIVRWFNDGHAFIYDADQSFVANVVTGDAEGEANARLIAAAPNLLAALRDMLKHHGNPPNLPEVIKAHRAIAKGDG